MIELITLVLIFIGIPLTTVLIIVIYTSIINLIEVNKKNKGGRKEMERKERMDEYWRKKNDKH